MREYNPLRLLEQIEAAIFDLDGVLTDTGTLHFETWRNLFDEFFDRRGNTRAPLTIEDYCVFLDGKSRSGGIRRFLDSRGIELPETSEQNVELGSVEALAREKERRYMKRLKGGDIHPYRDAVGFVEALRRRGLSAAVVSSSHDSDRLLQQLDIQNLFDVRVDGTDIIVSGMNGKPAPDIYLQAARRLGVSPLSASVFEECELGVRAAKAGTFAKVIGVIRRGNGDKLANAGADLLINNFHQLEIDGSVSSLETDEDNRRGD